MKHPMTKRGAELLRTELHRLKTVERPAITQAIAEARGHGDLSENAEYEAARDRQGLIEARIRDIETKLANAQIIDPKLLQTEGRCVFGATVEVAEASGETATWQIVGEDEADIKAKRLAITSPLARALVGKSVGDQVEVTTPGGSRSYEISKVAFKK